MLRMPMNAYNEGRLVALRRQGSIEDCPYRSDLMAQERQEWLREFAAGTCLDGFLSVAPMVPRAPGGGERA